MIDHVHRILIVEDDQLTAQMYAQALTCRLFTCEIVNTAQAAIQRIAAIGSPAFDGILTDLIVSDSKGLDFIRKLQEVAPAIPIIVASGYDFDPLEVIAAGAQDFLRKPIGQDDVRFAISKAIARHQVRREYKPIKSDVAELRQSLEESGRVIDAVLRKPKSDPPAALVVVQVPAIKGA